MKKTNKTSLRLIALVAVIALALGAVVGGTLAYLMDKTEPVVNTFTFGNINIDLTEDGAELNPETGEYNNEYKVMPGDTVAKDPIITVKEGSEACWLYVQLDKTYKFTDYMTYEIADGWTQLEGKSNVWYREVPAVAADAQFKVLKDGVVHVKPEITKEQVDALKSMPKLTVTAYAVQKDNFDDPVAAFTAKDTEFVKDEAALKDVIRNTGTHPITLTGDVVVEEATKAGVDSKTGEELTALITNRAFSRTIDLADYTLSGKDGMDVTYGLNIVSNMKTNVVLNADKGGIDLSKNGNTAYCVYVNGGNSYRPSLTINGGVYKGGTSCVQLQGGTCTINGGYFEVTDPDTQYLLNIIDSRRDSSQFIITGGTFVNYDPSNITNEGANHTSYVAEGYHVETSEVDGKILYTVVADGE